MSQAVCHKDSKVAQDGDVPCVIPSEANRWMEAWRERERDVEN